MCSLDTFNDRLLEDGPRQRDLPVCESPAAFAASAFVNVVAADIKVGGNKVDEIRAGFARPVASLTLALRCTVNVPQWDIKLQSSKYGAPR